MKTCVNCGHANKDEAKFCGACGSKFEPAPESPAAGQRSDEMTCPVCGYQNRPGVHFCGKCGRDLSKVAEVEALASATGAAHDQSLAAPTPDAAPNPQVVEVMEVAPTGTGVTEERDSEQVADAAPAASGPQAIATCLHCGTVIRYCPCCGEPLSE